MYRQLINALDGIGRPRIWVVGDLMLDRYVYGNAVRISPEAPIQVLKVVEEESRLGGAGSVVNNLRTLGADVAVFGILGRDTEGDMVLDRLRTSGAGVGGVLRIPDWPTTVKTRFVGRAQLHIPQQILRVDREEAGPIGGQIQDRLLARMRKGIHNAGAVLLSDYNKGVLTENLTRQIIRLARSAGVPVVVDPLLGSNYSKYAGATLLTPNRVEAETAGGISLKNLEDLKLVSRKLISELRLEALVVTLDKEGAYLARNGRPGQLIPTRPRNVYDNAGAGDMVISVVALAIAAGESLLNAVRLANVAAGIEVERFGVHAVSREEIMADLLAEARRRGDKERSLASLLIDLSRHRALGETIVFTSGCFDSVHAGHIAFFEFAAGQGDVLVVGVRADRGARASKGRERRARPQDERARVLAALEPVDYVVQFEEATPRQLIEAIQPDVLVDGEDGKEGRAVSRIGAAKRSRDASGKRERTRRKRSRE